MRWNIFHNHLKLIFLDALKHAGYWKKKLLIIKSCMKHLFSFGYFYVYFFFLFIKNSYGIRHQQWLRCESTLTNNVYTCCNSHFNYYFRALENTKCELNLLLHWWLHKLHYFTFSDVYNGKHFHIIFYSFGFGFNLHISTLIYEPFVGLGICLWWKLDVCVNQFWLWELVCRQKNVKN